MSNVFKSSDPFNHGVTVKYETNTERVAIGKLNPSSIEHTVIPWDDRCHPSAISGRDQYDIQYENYRERVTIRGVDPANIIRTRKDLMTLSKETAPLEKYRVIVRNTTRSARDAIVFDSCESFSEDQAMFILRILDTFTKESFSMVTGELIRPEVILGEGGGETNG